MITGKVFDAVTMEPIAFVDVYFMNTYIGSKTDLEGAYEFTTDKPNDSLTARFMGYISSTKPIKKGESQVIDFQLVPSPITLNEVVILPGENPAVTILKKVWKNKKKYNIDRLDAYQYESYSKTQVYLRRLFNPGKKIDTTSDKIINKFTIPTDDLNYPALPVYMSEVASDVYEIKNPLREKVVIKAVKTNSLAAIETDMVTQLIQKSVKYNFNNNFVKILDKDFVSPISTAGLFYYKYYLTDSLFIDGKRCYEIKVKARRKEDLTFNGTIWINDTTFALKRISVEVDKEANLNFVKRIKIQQSLEPVDSGAWIPVKTRIVADAVNIFINAYIVNSKIVINKPRGLSFYDKELEVADSAYNSKQEFWDKIRPEKLEKTDISTSSKIDSLKKRLKIRVLAKLTSASVKGFYNLGKFELGPFVLFYGNNNVEGSRFRLGFKTNSDFSKNWILKGYLAYGTKDNKFKYSGQVERFLSRKSWTKVGVVYTQDVDRMGSSDDFFNYSTFLSFTSSFGGSDKISSTKVGRLWIESDLFRGFTQKILFTNKYISPLSPDYFFEYYTDKNKTRTSSEINLSEITFSSIYQPKATFIIDKNERFQVALKQSPVFSFNYTVGLKGVLNSDFYYHKASVDFRHRLPIGGIGIFIYSFRLAKAFTPLPYPLLNMYAGNETIIRSDRTYNLMNYGEFIADQSLEFFCSFRLDGLILDKIPLIKKLGLRTVATAHIAYGSFDEKKNGTYNAVTNPEGILPEFDIYGNKLTGFNTLSYKKPYVEVSYGIENIFKIFRVDFIHRLSYLDNINPINLKKVSAFGIKIGGTFRF